ncbi:MAG: transposase [Candidatus Marinimicrobia bacterium]|nr:transposase [Candidatus Neomarinimicrobiota bacterium]
MANAEKWYPEQYYHIYNRGNNHSTIFYTDSNYHYFLDKFSEYLLDYIDIIAYTLISNHFHFLIKIKTQRTIIKNFLKKYPGKGKEVSDNEEIVNKIIGQAFSNMFNSYIKFINKQENRTGGLFEGKCQRKLIKSDEYLNALIAYIQYNPIKHVLTQTSEVFLNLGSLNYSINLPGL